MFHGEIARLTASTNPTVGGLQPSVVVRETVAHELVHLHDANPPVYPWPWLVGATATYGHCSRAAWDSGACLMNGARTRAERGDDRVSLHNAPWVGSEWWQILYRAEPLPQSASDKPAVR